MAHHQGMTIVAIADVAVRRRDARALPFRADHQSHRTVAAGAHAARRRDVATLGGRGEGRLPAPAISRLPAAAASPPRNQATPATHLLSNGRFSTLLTSAGSGYSRWGDLALTRWREDATLDDFGSYIYIKDVRTGSRWSAGFQPSGVEADVFGGVLRRPRRVYPEDGSLTTALDVIVSGEDDAEVRRVSITNSGIRTRDPGNHLLCRTRSRAAERRHRPSRLFETVCRDGISRRYRRDCGHPPKAGADEPEIWAAHLTVVDGDLAGATEFETDRARFLGRGRSVRTAIAVTDKQPLSNSVGATLDPIFAIRRRVKIAPGATVRVAFWTLAAASREALLDSIDKRRDATAYTRASMLAWTQAQAQLYHLGVTAGEASLFQRLAGHVIYAAPALRPSSETICAAPARNRDFGRKAFPAICRSCLSAFPIWKTSAWCGNCCRRTSIGS